jgi:uncharacterized protein YecE (DUF72 family)
VRLGTSSWSYPGWAGIVWSGEHSESRLAKSGLAAYAAHPLLGAVGIDRSFYQPLSAVQYAAYAAQVPGDFRFVVKAPASVTDALVRDESGRARIANPLFLVPAARLADLPGVLARLEALLQALPPLRPQAPDAVVAVQVRDAAFLGPAFADVLRAGGATYCLGLHAKMPPIEDQLPMLRALWPGPLVCRWNLHRRHGPYGYGDAEELYAPYDRLADPDPQTRRQLAKVALATAAAGHPVLVTIGNKAEGCSPLSVAALAEEIAAQANPAAR